MPKQIDLTPVQPRLLRTEQAAQYLNLSPRTVGRLVAAGELPVIRHFKWFRFDRADLDDFIERIK